MSSIDIRITMMFLVTSVSALFHLFSFAYLLRYLARARFYA